MSTAETPVRRVGPQDTDGKRPEVDKQVEKLAKAVDSFINDPSTFREYLRMLGAMHNYSWNNTALILIDKWYRKMQEQELFTEYGKGKSKAWLKANPNPYDPERWDKATITMGYGGWRKQGRQVVKKASSDNPNGSQAIALFKPVIIKVQDKETGKIETKCIGFEIIHKTFHVQDTDGPDYDTPTPKPMHDTDETREASQHLCRWLSRTALDDLGVPKIMRDKKTDRLLGEAQGGMIGKEQTITRNGEKVTLEENTIMVKSTLDYCQAAKTLAHEMAHVIAEHGKVTNYHSDGQARAACEAIAEGAAFVVMTHYGYDTTDYSVPYIAGWAKDTNVVKQVLKDIGDVAKVIITKTDARMNPAADKAA